LQKKSLTVEVRNFANAKMGPETRERVQKMYVITTDITLHDAYIESHD